MLAQRSNLCVETHMGISPAIIVEGLGAWFWFLFRATRSTASFFASRRCDASGEI